MKTLFDSWKLKHLTIKNRICVPAMICNGFVVSDSYVSDKHLHHYRNIAKGGAGLIVVEATRISKDAGTANDQLGIWDDTHIDGLSKIANVIHQENTFAILQMYHAGGVANGDDLYSASNYSCVKRGQIKEAKEMTHSQIQDVQKQFVDAAIRAYKAGFDGIEIHGCHSYLISQFLCRKVNKRTDEYGKNPTLFIQEIYESIRKQTSNDFIIGIRLGGFEPDLEDALVHAKALEKIGFDYLNISYGFSLEHEPYVPEDYPFKDIIYAADRISQEVEIPVFAVNGINTKELAASILEKTSISMVNIGRATLVNYNWANDVRENKQAGLCLNCRVCKWHDSGEYCPGKILYNKNKSE